MMHIQNKEAFKNILLTLGMVVCLFLAVCRDKSIDHYNRGTIYLQKGKYNRAISELTKAIELNPKDAGAYYKRGNAYGYKGKYAQAISDFTKVIQINPRLAEPYYDRILAYYYKGEYDKAWEDVHKTQSLGFQVPPEFLNELRKTSGREK
jgi:tetratricopeptide (TPR) repeat protein